jgi:hypothetical protein
MPSESPDSYHGDPSGSRGAASIDEPAAPDAAACGVLNVACCLSRVAASVSLARPPLPSWVTWLINNPATAETLPRARTHTQAVAATIEEVVTAIRLEAERRDLGTGTIVISAERLRHLMREFFLG